MSVLLGFIGRKADTGMSEELPERLDGRLVTNATVVRVVQEGFDPVQYDTKTATARSFNLGTKVMQQGLHFSPVNVAANGILEDCTQQVQMLMAHNSRQSLSIFMDGPLFAALGIPLTLLY